jgi:peptide-methionine (S)-S-oxide reductase
MEITVFKRVFAFALLLAASPEMAGRAAAGGADPLATATFAGGCFWCMEPPYDKLPGVVDTISGYTGGRIRNPTYEQVSSGGTGHYEALQVRYDPRKVTYEKLLEVFWMNIDPYDGAGQFCDRGSQYRAAVFYHDEEQRRLAEASKRQLETSGKLKGRIMTDFLPAPTFYRAEDYHQNYYQENPVRYKLYRYGCGRDRRLKEIWGREVTDGSHL